MLVDYYGVMSCACEVIHSRPVLIAPVGYAPEMLVRSGFVQLPDGRWGHYLNEGEYGYIIRENQTNPAQNVVFGTPNVSARGTADAADQETPEDRKTAVILCLASVACMIFGGTSSILLTTGGSSGFHPTSLLSIAGLVLMIVVRVKYPKNTFGKVLMWLWITMFVIALFYMVTIIIACQLFLDSCGQNCR